MRTETNSCYGTEWNFFHVRKRAIVETFLYIDNNVPEYPLEAVEEKPLTSSPDYSDDESNYIIITIHKSKLKVMLLVLMF